MEMRTKAGPRARKSTSSPNRARTPGTALRQSFTAQEGLLRTIGSIITPTLWYRVLLCSGKVFYDLAAAREERKDSAAAIVRVEQMYPFPDEALRRILASYPGARDVVWVQEESKNMGAWTFISRLLEEVLPAGAVLRYAGRAPSAAVATGNAGVHKRELAALLAEALGR